MSSSEQLATWTGDEMNRYCPNWSYHSRGQENTTYYSVKPTSSQSGQRIFITTEVPGDQLNSSPHFLP